MKRILIADTLDDALANINAQRDVIATLTDEQIGSMGVTRADLTCELDSREAELYVQFELGRVIPESEPEWAGPIRVKNAHRIHAHWKLRMVGSERAQLLGTVDSHAIRKDIAYAQNLATRERENNERDEREGRRMRNRARNQRRKRASK